MPKFIKKITITFSPEEIAEIIKSHMINHSKFSEIDESTKINVNYKIEEVGGDPMDRYRGTDTVTGITVSYEA